MYGNIIRDAGELRTLQRGTAFMFALLLVSLFVVEAVAAEQRHHDSHVHGIGSLNVAQDGNSLVIELDSPAANIVGFEHAPENEEQEQAMHAATDLLKEGDKLFVLPAAGKCSLQDVDVHDGIEEHHDEHGHHDKHDGHDDHDHGDGHSDIEVTYLFECGAPQRVKSIDVRLFEYFPGFNEIDVQLIVPGKQTAVELTHDNHTISF